MRLLALLTISIILHAQATVSLSSTSTSVPVGTPVTITASLVADGRQIPALQGDFSTTFTTPTVIALNKTLECFQLRCVIYGLLGGSLNSLSLNGNLFSITFTPTAPGQTIIAVSSLVGVDPTGTPVAITAGTSVTIAATAIVNPFDVDRNGVVDFRDVILAAQQVSGRSPCTTGDVNTDGKCNTQDVQLIIHATGN